MAKVLWKAKGPPGIGQADAALGPGNAFIGALLRSIINGQNMQVMHMYGYLKFLAAQRQETGFVETYDVDCAQALTEKDMTCHCGIECAMKVVDECECEPEMPSCDVKGTKANPCKHTSGSGTEEDPYVFAVAANYLLSDTGYYTFP
eukprot:3380970-Rhodomonas_salina.1